MRIIQVIVWGLDIYFPPLETNEEKWEKEINNLNKTADKIKILKHDIKDAISHKYFCGLGYQNVKCYFPFCFDTITEENNSLILIDLKTSNIGALDENWKFYASILVEDAIKKHYPEAKIEACYH